MVKPYLNIKQRVLFLLLFCTVSMVHAQSKRYTDKDYARHPLWINMMEDTTANFFEVEKAYNTYWAHHEKPEGEDDEIGSYREREKIPGRRKQRRITAENKLRMSVKKYEVWHEQTLPYVQADGRILTPSERLKIWQQQRGNK